jgi:hypothetical protein
LLSKNIKIITVILPVVLYACETWSLILREKQAEGFPEQGAEKNIRTRQYRREEDHTTRSFMISIPHQILFA